MFKANIIQFIFFLFIDKLILTKDVNIIDITRQMESQISSLRNEENLKYMLKNGGIYNCDKNFCSQISFLESQTKKNQIQKFPQINIINSKNNIDKSKIIIAKIFYKHSFPLDSDNYISGINSISDFAYFKLFILNEEEENNITPFDLSLIGYDNLLVYLPLYISDSLKNKILSISGQNPENDIESLKDYDIFDPESKIYTDICHPITFSISVEDISGKDSLKNLDITLEQRKKYYFPGNVNLCPLGCKYFGIDKDTISSVCTCNEEYFNNILSEDFIENEEYINFNFDKKDFYDSNNDIYFSLNTLKCLKLPFTSIGFKNNYGSIIIIILALVIISCFLILTFIGRDYLISTLELICNSIPQTSKIFPNEVIEINKKEINSKSNNDLMISTNSKIKKKNSTRVINIKNENQEENKNNPPKKKYSLIGDGIDLNRRKSKDRKIMEEFMKENKDEIEQPQTNIDNHDNNDKQDDDALLKLKEQYENEIKKLKEKNEKDMKKLRQEKDKEIKQLKNDIENLKNKPEKISNNYKTNDSEVKSLLVSVPLDFLFTDQEKNAMDLKNSLNYDKRSFFEIYYSFINMKQPLFFLFNYYSKIQNNIFQIKLNSLRFIIFCYEIYIYMFLYATFFGSKSISKIYFGNFNFGKKCVLGIILSPFCMIIKSVMQYFLYDSLNKKIILVKLKSYSYFIFEKDKVNQINALDGEGMISIRSNEDFKNNNTDRDKNKKEKLNNEFIGFIQDLIDSLKLKFLIFFIASILVMFFEWCVISSFCSVYKNSQIEYFISIIICYLFSNIYAFIYCFIPSSLRYFALKMNSSLLFKIAEIAKLI